MNNQLIKTLITLGILSAASSFASGQSITFGVSPGPHAEAAYVVKDLAEKAGTLDIKIVEFDDYITPNEALATGDIDANSFQHKPFLDDQSEQNDWDFHIAGYNFLFPMALYSHKIKDISELKDGDRIVIQNDPTNGGRALLLLESLGIIEIDDEAGLVPSKLDITKNDKNLEFIEIAAPETINYIEDVALVSINTDFITLSDKVSRDDVVVRENADSPYTNIVVVRTEDKDEDWVKELIKLYHTDAVKAVIEETYGDDVVLAW